MRTAMKEKKKLHAQAALRGPQIGGDVDDDVIVDMEDDVGDDEPRSAAVVKEKQK